MSRFRFSLRHVFFAVAAVSVFLTAYLLFVRWKTREGIAEVYGSYDVYVSLRDSPRFEVYSATPVGITEGFGIAPDFPSHISTNRCAPLSESATNRLRTLLVFPENFPRDIVKDFSFRPSVMLKPIDKRHNTNIYFCFDSNMAAIVVGKQIVGVLVTDTIAAELQELFSSVSME